MPAIVILPTLPDALRRDAAELIYTAFERKWRVLTGAHSQRLVALLAESLRADQVLTAVDEGRLVGVANLGYGRSSAQSASLGACLRHMGLLRGLLAWLVLRRLGGHCPPDELHVETLAVDAAYRGQGIGTRLLEAAIARARQRGYAAARLEVVDTNAGARRLYERLGFVAIATRNMPFVPASMGFRAEIVMRRAMD
ncbi:MAG: GNAT family N-acetyltransferase [Chloroflexota bacterium]